MKKIPITLITGFLGAGKSTLVNRILKEQTDLKFGLILNEFGDVKLESQIVEANDEEVVELDNGCMCCVARKDIIESVLKLIEAQPKLDHIIIEASGLSDPVPIGQILMQMPTVKDPHVKINLETIICVVDAINFTLSTDDFIVATKQLEFASYVVLTKSAEAGIEQTDKVRTEIQRTAEDAIVRDYESLDLNEMLDYSTIDHSDIKAMEEAHEHEGHDHHSHEEHDHKHDKHDCDHHKHDHDGHEHHHDHVHEHFTEVFYKTKNPLNLHKFQDFLRNYSDSIIRAKGFIHFAGEYAEPKFILQCVGARKDTIVKKWKPGEEKQTAIVFLGKDFDKHALLAQITACEVH